MNIEICEYCGKPGDYPVCRPPSKPSKAELLSASDKRVKELEAVTNLEKLEQDLRTMAARELHLNGEASKDLLTQYADDLKRLLHPEDK